MSVSWQRSTLIVIPCSHEECCGVFATLGAPEIEMTVHRTALVGLSFHCSSFP